MRAGDLVELTLSTISPSGDGLGTLPEYAPASLDAAVPPSREIHVPGAFPGETARVRLLHVSRQHPRAHAELRELLAPHPARRDPPCPHHGLAGACNGCPLLPLPVDAQRIIKAELLAHTFDLIRHMFTGGTDPIDIHESLCQLFPDVPLGYGLTPRAPIGSVSVKVKGATR